MPAFDFDLSTVPDKLLPIGTGFVEFQVKEIRLVKTKGDAAAGVLPKDMYEINSVVHTENDDKGRAHTERAVPSSKGGQVTIKRLALSCGLPLAGLTTEAFTDKIWKGSVSHEVGVYNGRQTTQARVEILIPGDQGF